MGGMVAKLLVIEGRLMDRTANDLMTVVIS